MGVGVGIQVTAGKPDVQARDGGALSHSKFLSVPSFPPAVVLLVNSLLLPFSRLLGFPSTSQVSISPSLSPALPRDPDLLPSPVVPCGRMV